MKNFFIFIQIQTYTLIHPFYNPILLMYFNVYCLVCFYLAIYLNQKQEFHQIYLLLKSNSEQKSTVLFKAIFVCMINLHAWVWGRKLTKRLLMRATMTTDIMVDILVNQKRLLWHAGPYIQVRYTVIIEKNQMRGQKWGQQCKKRGQESQECIAHEANANRTFCRLI